MDQNNKNYTNTNEKKIANKNFRGVDTRQNREGVGSTCTAN